jgi:hypothetical protein
MAARELGKRALGQSIVIDGHEPTETLDEDTACVTRAVLPLSLRQVGQVDVEQPIGIRREHDAGGSHGGVEARLNTREIPAVLMIRGVAGIL